jgi:uncharacterized membrane protein YfcA
MDPLHILLLLAGGALTGLLAGFFGVGGGIILVPMLLAYLSATGVSSLVATHIAFGTSLLVVIFTSLSSAYEYQRNGHVVWRAVLIMGIGSVAGAWLGSGVASELRGETLQRIFAGVVVIAAIRLLSEQRKPKGEQEARPGAAGLSLTGVVVGVVSSLAGVGGGVLSIPIMYSLLHFPLKKALGTSSATIVITAVAAVIGYVVRGWGNPILPPSTLGYVDYLAAIPLAVTSIPLARVGASLAHRMHADTLRKYFAAFLLVIAAKMFFFP